MPPPAVGLQTFTNVCNFHALVKPRRTNRAPTPESAMPSPSFPQPSSSPVPAPRRAGVAVAVLALAVLAACGQQQPGGGFHGFPPAQVSTYTVEPKTIPVTYDYVGQTTGSKEVEVRARVTGILEQKYFQEGAAVQKGQRLFTIDPKPLQAQAAAAEAEVVRAQAQKAQAEREAARLKPLAERKAIGQKEADDAASNAEFAVANVRSAEAKLREVQLSLGYTNVVAPIGGLTSRAPKSEGSLVNANETLLTTIWQVHPIWVPFAIPENEQLVLQKEVAAGRLALPKDNAFDVTIKLTDGTVFPRQGRINFADSRVNPATGSVEYRAEIPNADGALKPGQFVRVKLTGAKRTGAIAVPQIAVLDGPQGKFVYVVDKDKDGKDVAAARPLTLGEWVETPDAKSGNLWIVQSGLKAGDRVIVDGIAKLRPGAPIVLGGGPGAPGGPGGPGGPPGGAAPADKGAAPAAKS
jgi:membrane fusion protein (multidrug efflux system)